MRLKVSSNSYILSKTHVVNYTTNLTEWDDDKFLPQYHITIYMKFHVKNKEKTLHIFLEYIVIVVLIFKN